MSLIILSSSMALDILCFIQKSSLGEHNNVRWMSENQIAEIEHLNSQLPSNFSDDCISMSTLSLIISTYADNNVESLSINDLINIFSSPKDLSEKVASKIKNGFTASYVFPILKMIEETYAEKYIKKLEILKAINFEEQYTKRILPTIKKEINKCESRMLSFDIEALCTAICRLKSTSELGQIKVFFSFFSSPTAFTLYNGSFLTCLGGNIDFYALTAHELMHGFADSELIELYKNYVCAYEHLRNMHDKLTNDMHSGDEEEFVIAAEYYLCLLSGKYKKEELLKYAQCRYNGVCPTSVKIFELLANERDIPNDYCSWLKEQFANGRL